MNITALSLGAGVQSTTLALMAIEGLLPRPDLAIFADTGWEPRRVYDHLDRLSEVMWAAGIRLLRVSAGNLREDAIDPEHRYASIPYFVRNPDGSEGMGRRQCTSEYKLDPIRRKVRAFLGAEPPDYRRVPRGNHAEQWIGFSADEVGRVRDSDVSYITNRHPLIEMGMTRRQCELWLQSRGWTSVAKSACVGCPYHGNAQWRELRDTCKCGHHTDDHYDSFGFWPRISPDVAGRGVSACAHCDCDFFDAPEWADAVSFDEAIRKGGARGLPLNGEAFLHRSRLPLSVAPIDHRTRVERRGEQLDVLDELGDPDGCSPYGCRSGWTEAGAYVR